MSLRVLIVDDEPDIRTIATLALQDIAGFQVEAVESGEMAIQRVPNADFDLILLDMMMPGMDGMTTFTRLHEAGRVPPVIFMTAKTQRKEMQTYLAHGAVGVIRKPFDPVSLGDEITSILAEASKASPP